MPLIVWANCPCVGVVAPTLIWRTGLGDITEVRPGIVLIDFCSRKRHCSIGSRCARGLKIQKTIPCEDELRDPEPARVKNWATLVSASTFSFTCFWKARI